MRIGLSRWAIKAGVAHCEDTSKLLERFGFAWSFSNRDIRVVPFFELQNLNHIRHHADTSLLRGREYLFACDVG
jgi:hypothetical protein